MSNHCVFVTCVGCGTEFCARGCAYVSAGNLETAKLALDIWVNEAARNCIKPLIYCPNCNSNRIILS